MIKAAIFHSASRSGPPRRDQSVATEQTIDRENDQYSSFSGRRVRLRIVLVLSIGRLVRIWRAWQTGLDVSDYEVDL